MGLITLTEKRFSSFAPGKYIFLRPFDIFLNLADKVRRGIETNFISDPFFKIDLNFLPIDFLMKIQNINLQ
jgi:hypothetical protein